MSNCAGWSRHRFDDCQEDCVTFGWLWSLQPCFLLKSKRGYAEKQTTSKTIQYGKAFGLMPCELFSKALKISPIARCGWFHCEIRPKRIKTQKWQESASNALLESLSKVHFELYKIQYNALALSRRATARGAGRIRCYSQTALYCTVSSSKSRVSKEAPSECRSSFCSVA